MRKFEYSDYKYKLIQDIINSEKIVNAIDSDAKAYNPDEPDSLVGVNIFPHIFIPQIQSSTLTYIMMACDVNNINSSNPSFIDIKLTVRVMTHREKLFLKDEKSTRLDYISSELIGLLDDSSKYGLGRLRLVSDREIILNERYIFRELVFKTVDMTKGCSARG